MQLNCRLSWQELMQWNIQFLSTQKLYCQYGPCKELVGTFFFFSGCLLQQVPMAGFRSRKCFRNCSVWVLPNVSFVSILLGSVTNSFCLFSFFTFHNTHLKTEIRWAGWLHIVKEKSTKVGQTQETNTALTFEEWHWHPDWLLMTSKLSIFHILSAVASWQNFPVYLTQIDLTVDNLLAQYRLLTPLKVVQSSIAYYMLSLIVQICWKVRWKCHLCTLSHRPDICHDGGLHAPVREGNVQDVWRRRLQH